MAREVHHMEPEFSPYDDRFQMDPYPVYAWLRDKAPVFYNGEDDFWALSRHADVYAAMQRDDFNFMTDFAVLLPRDVICELIGVPENDRAEIRRLVDLTVHREEGSRDIPKETMDGV